MMVAMMLPSLVPVLWYYRQTLVRLGHTPLGRLSALVGTGYFLAWSVFGLVAFALGVAMATIAMQWPVLARGAPVAASVMVVIAGALQFTAWKAQHLARCRTMPACAASLPADAASAWRHGLHLGLHCIICCAGLTAVLLVVGVMDWRAMALVTGAITAERLAPDGERVARVIGAVVVAAGLFLLMRAAGLS